MLLILAAFLLIGYGVQAVFADGHTDHTKTGQASEEELDIDADMDEVSDGESDRTKEEEPVTFDNIESVMAYDIPEEIAERLNAKVFDHALVKYLEKNELISTASGDDSSIGIYSAVSDGLITEDVIHDVFFFDRVVSSGHRQIVTVAVGSDGEYTFSTD